MTIYDIFFFVFSLIYLPYLVVKGKAHADFAERFGVLPGALKEAGKSGPLWIHAVSVGEVIAVKDFAEALLREHPRRRVVLSTTTKTGAEVAKKTLSGDIIKFYFPLDFTFVIRRALNIINPACIFIVETELWPNLISELYRRKVPVVLINGRLSERSYRGYKIIKCLFAGVLQKVTVFCMQTKADADRITSLGAPPERVKVTGNMKFDKKEKEWGQVPKGTCPHSSLLIAGSTHRGEEEIVLRVYEKLIKQFSDLRLLIAPRHIDRAEAIKKLVMQKGFAKAVSVLDTHGELSRLFSSATVVFMGGSLIRRGGHNIIEPAIYGKPIIFGPHMFNFRDIAALFLANRAAIQIKNERELFEALKTLLGTGDKNNIGPNAKKLIETQRGATERTIRICNLVRMRGVTNSDKI